MIIVLVVRGVPLVQGTEGTVQRRSLDFADFEAVEKEIDRLQQGGYQRAGNWDLAQICDHLSQVMEGSLKGFSFQAPWILRKLLAPLILRHVMKTRTMRAGVRVPEMAPAARVDPDESIRRCRQLLQQVQHHTGEFQPSPFFGRLSPEQWRQLHLIHAAHHLSFLVPA
jgi:hypothetical protein